MTRSPIERWTPAAALLLLLAPLAAHAAGGSSSVTPSLSPEEEALGAYNAALKLNDEGRALLARAREAEGKEKEKLLAKAEKTFGKAARRLEGAIAAKPDFYQAHTSLGFALRSMGDYEEALAAYDTALGIEPRYGEAIEYRAEAHLKLGRIDETKEAYMTLFRDNRELAAELMEAMQQWVDDQRAAGTADAAIDELESWIRERGEAAARLGDSDRRIARRW